MPIPYGFLFIVDPLVHVSHEVVKVLIKVYVVNVEVGVGSGATID